MAFHSFNPIFEKSQLAESQKIRDREMRRIRSFIYPNRTNENRIHTIKCMKDIIQDLDRHGPAGLIHIAVLSSIIKKPIKIWNADGSLNRIIGKTKIGCPVDIEYHAIDLKQIGHWTLRYGKDPDNVTIDLNSCLFSVIGSQTGQDPLELRRCTVLNLKNNLQELANRINEILQLKENDRMTLMIGGARYCGTSPSHARIILDKSQNSHSHECNISGHPRGHASHPVPNNVESYSRNYNSWKTAFLSRTDQDYVTHLALRSPMAQEAMKRLNQGSKNETVKIPAEMLRNSRNNLPKAREYLGGISISAEKDIKKVVLVLRHHQGQFNNPGADVFVHTCYPMI